MNSLHKLKSVCIFVTIMLAIIRHNFYFEDEHSPSHVCADFFITFTTTQTVAPEKLMYSIQTMGDN